MKPLPIWIWGKEYFGLLPFSTLHWINRYFQNGRDDSTDDQDKVRRFHCHHDSSSTQHSHRFRPSIGNGSGWSCRIRPTVSINDDNGKRNIPANGQSTWITRIRSAVDVSQKQIWEFKKFVKIFLKKSLFSGKSCFIQIIIIKSCSYHSKIPYMKSKENLQVSDNHCCVGRLYIYYENCDHFGRIGCQFRVVGLQSLSNRENIIFPGISERGLIFKLKFKSK